MRSFFVDDTLIAKVMSQNHSSQKIEHSEIEVDVTATNMCVQGAICSEVYVMSIHHL